MKQAEHHFDREEHAMMTQRTGRARAALAVACILIGAAALAGCLNTPPLSATLVIQDPETAKWMTVNNSFILPPDSYYTEPSKQLWQGVLIQLGESWSPEGAEIGLTVKVKVTPMSGDPKEYALSDLRWINIVPADKGGRYDPMGPEHAGLLWPDPNTPSKCEAAERACAGQPCLCVSPPCKQEDLVSLPEPCLRRRTLHAYFKASAVITYWTGPNLFEVQMEDDYRHPVHVFTLKDPVTADVTKTDGSVDKYPAVKRIEIAADEGPDHHKVKDPPGNG